MRQKTDTIIVTTRRQATFVSWTIDLLVDIVVLNFFVEYVSSVVIDSFLISVLTALLMKLMIDGVKGLEHRVGSYFKSKDGMVYRVTGLFAVWSILFLSKFVILEAVDIVFGDHVELGHFLEIVGIVVTMLVARGVLQAIYERLGPSGSTTAPTV